MFVSPLIGISPPFSLPHRSTGLQTTQACGVSLPGTENSPSRPTPPNSISGDTIPYLPALVEACLGVAGGVARRPPFIGASAVSRIVGAAIAAGPGAVVADEAVPSGRGGAAAVKPGMDAAAGVGIEGSGQASALPLALLEGLLGVLAASERGVSGSSGTMEWGSGGDGGGSAGGDGSGGKGKEGQDDDGAMMAVRDKALPLLLASFSMCGHGREAARVWRDCGATALAALAFPRSSSLSSSSPSSLEAAGEARLRHASVWREFSDGAVEHIRRVMEGGDNEHGDASPMAAVAAVAAGTGAGAAERAASLTFVLVELEKKAVRHRSGDRFGNRSGDRSGDLVTLEDPSSAAAAVVETTKEGYESAPVLWRLALTRPSTWRKRRAEAFSLEGSGDSSVNGDVPTAVVELSQELSRACVGSRWARRWECTALLLARFLDARARLAFLLEGVEGVGPASARVEVAGEALHEIILAGVIVARSAQVLKSEGFRGPETSDDGVVVDIPTGLLIPPSVKACGKVGGALGQGAPAGRGLGLRGGGGGGGDPAKEFGLGLPSFGNLARADGDKTPATMAASVTWAAVRDAVLSYAASDPAELTAPEAIKASVTRKTSAVRGRHRMGKIEDAGSDFGEHHPYDLLLPPDLWRAAFEPLPQAQPAAAGGGVVASLPFIHTVGGDMTASGMRGTGQQREFPRAAVSVLHGGAVPAPVAGAGSEEDMRLHGVVLSALRCSVDTTAAFAMDVYEAGEWGEEVRGHSLQVSASLLVTVVGEVFARGLGLGDEAKRCVV